MRKIRQLADKHQSILIVDDIQAGCGRTGKFFSFEHHGVLPDMVVLAKAISGFGLPMSLLLIRPDLDTWCPGEHNGTFRGNNHAFVTASAALETFWQNDDFEAEISEKSSFLREALDQIAEQHGFLVKGRGMFLGIELGSNAVAAEVRRTCFESGLIIETCGPHDSVLKFLPPLTISQDDIQQACSIVLDAIEKSCQRPTYFGRTA